MDRAGNVGENVGIEHDLKKYLPHQKQSQFMNSVCGIKDYHTSLFHFKIKCLTWLITNLISSLCIVIFHI